MRMEKTNPPQKPKTGKSMTNTLPTQARVMIGVVVGTSLCVLTFGVMHITVQNWSHFVLLLGTAALSSRFKVKLPGMTSSMSANVPIILLAVTQLGLLGSLGVAAVAAVTQSYSSGEKKTTPIQFVFNACTLINAAGLAHLAFHNSIAATGSAMHYLPLVLAAGAYLLANTAPIAFTGGGSPFGVWQKVFLWSFPNYVMGAGLTAIVSSVSTIVNWPTVTALMLLLFGIYQSYRMYVGQVPQEQARAAAAAGGR